MSNWWWTIQILLHCRSHSNTPSSRPIRPEIPPSRSEQSKWTTSQHLGLLHVHGHAAATPSHQQYGVLHPLHLQHLEGHSTQYDGTGWCTKLDHADLMEHGLCLSDHGVPMTTFQTADQQSGSEKMMAPPFWPSIRLPHFRRRCPVHRFEQHDLSGRRSWPSVSPAPTTSKMLRLGFQHVSSRTGYPSSVLPDADPVPRRQGSGAAGWCDVGGRSRALGAGPCCTVTASGG